MEQPGAFKQQARMDNEGYMLEKPMGPGCKRRTFQVFRGNKPQFADPTKRTIGELTGGLCFLSLKETSIADCYKYLISFYNDWKDWHVASNLPIEQNEQFNRGLTTHFHNSSVNSSYISDNLPYSSATDPNIQRRNIPEPGQSMDRCSTAVNMKLDSDRKFHHSFGPPEIYLKTATVDQTPVPTPSDGSMIENFPEYASIGSQKPLIVFRDPVLESGTFCSCNSSLLYAPAVKVGTHSSKAKICSDEQEIDPGSEQSAPKNNCFPLTRTYSRLETFIDINKASYQRPSPRPTEDSTDKCGLKSGVKYELAALEKWIQYHDEFPPNIHQLLQDRGICSLRQLYVQSAAVESLAESFKPIKRKQFMQVYSAFKSTMAVVFDPSSVHQLLQPVNGILKQHHNRIRKTKLVDFLRTVGSKFIDWEDDSKEDGGAVLEATEECASLSELKQQLESENTALEFINDLLFSDDDDDGGDAVDEAGSSTNNGIKAVNI